MATEFIIFASTFSLIVEIVVLALLTIGFWLKRNKKFRQHGITMSTALGLHIITILLVMVGSFLNFFSSPSTVDFTNILVLTTLIHTITGIAAALLGVWLVASWHLKTDMQTCFAKKKIMLTTLTLWLTAFFLGIILYIALIGSLPA